MKRTLRTKRLISIPAALLSAILLLYLLQRVWAHRTEPFVPDYPRIPLSETSDYDTLFLQTGLGRSAVDKLIDAGNFDAISNAQDAFFAPPDTDCTPLLGWFTREDRLVGGSSTPPLDLQPGDILLTLSTHSAGWRHGHAGLVIDSETTLESLVLGTDSTLTGVSHWSKYSNYAVLRPKDVTPELQQQVAQFALSSLHGVPYRLLSGFLGPKAPDPDAPQFGLHCSYLVWYAWNHFGYDLDSDGGRLVSTCDLLHSDQLEIVQLYGMDPREFLSP